MYKRNKSEEKGRAAKTTGVRKNSAADKNRRPISRRSESGSRQEEPRGKTGAKRPTSGRPVGRTRPTDDFNNSPKSRFGGAREKNTRDRSEERTSKPAFKRTYSDKPVSRKTRPTDDSSDRSKSRFSGSREKNTRDRSEERTSKPAFKRGYSDKPVSRTTRSRSTDDGFKAPRKRISRSEERPTRESGFQKSKPSETERRGVRKERDTENKAPYGRTSDRNTRERTTFREDRNSGVDRKRSGRNKQEKSAYFDRTKAKKEEAPQKDDIRLNRYIANAGICSRREADELIGAGLVSVNGKVITEMGYQVKPGDDVRYNGERLSREKKVYLLLNKPKDAITTMEDPAGRRTVMELFGNELGERVFPVGRLDRNTTGVLLFTNDGDLAQRLMHPKYEMVKVYKATLNKAFKGEDMWTLQNGVELEDGFIKPDELAYPDQKNKYEVGVEIHSGKNRIIHRLFEHLGYKVDKLDRALYAGLTKGKLKRGEWRHLTEKEVNALKRQVKLS